MVRETASVATVSIVGPSFLAPDLRPLTPSAQVRRAGVEPAMLVKSGWFTATEARPCPADANVSNDERQWRGSESNRQTTSSRFELDRFPGLRTAPIHYSVLDGT